MKYRYLQKYQKYPAERRDLYSRLSSRLKPAEYLYF